VFGGECGEKIPLREYQAPLLPSETECAWRSNPFNSAVGDTGEKIMFIYLHHTLGVAINC